MDDDLDTVYGSHHHQRCLRINLVALNKIYFGHDHHFQPSELNSSLTFLLSKWVLQSQRHII